MTTKYHATVVNITPADIVPGRFDEEGLWEIVVALGGARQENADVWLALKGVFTSMAESKLGERLLDAVLVEPPIPAGCDALLQAMKDPDRFPWRDHEVRKDRFWLWYCHLLVHRVMPDDFPPPPLVEVTLEITALDGTVKLPGKRATPRLRTALFGHVLAERSGVNPMATPDGLGDSEDWLFDVVWATEVTGRTKLTADELLARGATPENASNPKLFAVTMKGWLSPQWQGDLAEQSSWTVETPAP